MISNLGKYCLFIKSLFVNRERFSLYVRLTFEEAVEIGYNSIIIVALISTFIGGVTAIQTAYNMTNPLIPNTVIGFIVREMTFLELAPTITALVFAGKVGSSIAGQIGTMRITEQISALEVMGINSSSYLVLPKITATMITYPLLVILAIALGLTGGYLSTTLTGALTPVEYIQGIRTEFIPWNVAFALIKSIVFAFIISSVSAYEGFFTTGGALEVGKSSTRAVTNSCLIILVADFFLAELLL
ncbi:ABC transporter permease [Persicobacter psychrovividus]|uniref:ABC transporter permease n=1 Tax=Persicobacter psychrovividus TaxID=387638 RepID=A0ABM7VFP7_9BACT|nr:ABC transporter permease [Persicobacter psychrovividus]